MKNILKGISAYTESLYLIRKLKLWKYFLIPIAISLVFFVGVFVSIYSLADPLATQLDRLWIWETGKDSFHIAAKWLSAAIMILFSAMLYKHIVMILSSPFMSPVSEKIEAYLYPEFVQHKHHRKTTNLEQFMRSLRINMRNLSYEIMLTIPLIILSFIPIVGLVFTALAFLVQSYYAGFGNVDYTLERHFNYRESVNYVKKNRGLAIGNGILFMAMVFIPILGVILVLPFSVTAATKVTLDNLHQQKLLHTSTPLSTKS